MAYTTSAPVVVQESPDIITRFDLSTLDSDILINVPHGGNTGTVVEQVWYEVTTRPTDGSPVFMSHPVSSDSTTNDTVALRFRTIPGGSLDGAVVRVHVKFLGCASNSVGTWVSLGGTTIP
jgi:hypothetical protein